MRVTISCEGDPSVGIFGSYVSFDVDDVDTIFEDLPEAREEFRRRLEKAFEIIWEYRPTVVFSDEEAFSDSSYEEGHTYCSARPRSPIFMADLKYMGRGKPTVPVELEQTPLDSPCSECGLRHSPGENTLCSV